MKMGQSIWNTTENIDASLEDSEFELPMLNQSELENSSVSAADVLKTLFFILVRYNKTLLGDDLGKFPAALLMNTVHFRMQAVLSKAITWYWSHRYQPTVAMSWRDCLYRVVPTALSMALCHRQRFRALEEARGCCGVLAYGGALLGENPPFGCRR
ncbi:Nucleotide/sugar transporter family protein, putative [Theobroma cacao]|uniref:Nucleotide/sugar transporter family protein, putative n=1 Tax=Theobroma cacao TaxID=3641 RepID=A0A061F9F0_THECC|nr:Nucleotide/sugar transporter family protein, putative [Theobroma cacao]